MIDKTSILINASNIKSGGGIQVALDLILHFSKEFRGEIILLTSTELNKQIANSLNKIKTAVKVVYNDRSSIKSKWQGVNKDLDEIIDKYQIKIVFSIFGPIYWRPKVKHIVGYAKPHHIYTDSPFFKTRNLKQQLIFRARRLFELRAFEKNADAIWTETSDVSNRLEELFPGKIILTAGNFINQELKTAKFKDKQVFYKKDNELLILYPSAYYPHKNFEALVDISHQLNQLDISHKFICTTKKLYTHKDILFIGSRALHELAQIYRECDIVISTSLLECFSANYIEAMYFSKPLVVPNLSFAKTIVKEAGLYFEPESPSHAAKQIELLTKNKDLKESLIENGKNQITAYLNSFERYKKINELIEDLMR